MKIISLRMKMLKISGLTKIFYFRLKIIYLIKKLSTVISTQEK